MAYAKIDSKMFRNPKIKEAGIYATMLYIAGLAYCNEHLTDGFIPLSQLPGLYADSWQTGHKRSRQLLTKLGLWLEVVSEETGELTGYLVNDYLDFNKTKDEIEKLSAQRGKAGKKGMKTRWGNNKKPSETDNKSDNKRYNKTDNKSVTIYYNYNNKDLSPIGDNSFKDNNIDNINKGKKEDEMTQEVTQFLEYEKAFERLTGRESNALSVLDKAVKLVDEKVTIDEFETAITEMQGKGYTVATIASPINWIMNNRNKPKPGQRQAPDMGDYKVNRSNAQIFIEPEIQEALEEGLGRPIDRELDEEWLFDLELFKEKLRKFRPEMVA